MSRIAYILAMFIAVVYLLLVAGCSQPDGPRGVTVSGGGAICRGLSAWHRLRAQYALERL